MSDKESLVENEISEHLVNLDSWVEQIDAFEIPESRKGVTDRFKRDCKILKTDLTTNESPSAADLVDFVDRHNSLEVQFTNIVSDLS